jgi:hypothetical protein
MGMVDFSAYKMNPWDSYEKNREYLLERAGLEEDVAARQQRGDIANRNIALGYDQLGVQKSKLKEVSRATDIAEQQEDRLSQKQQDENKRKNQEYLANKYGYIANSMNIVNEENFDAVTTNLDKMLTDEIMAGPGTEQEKADMVQKIKEAIPDSYDEKVINEGFYELFSTAEKEDMDKVFLVSDDGTVTEIAFLPKDSKGVYTPPKGFRIVDKFETFKGIRDGNSADIESIKERLGLKKEEAITVKRELGIALMDFKDPSTEKFVFFTEDGEETEEFKNAMSEARKFYAANISNDGKLGEMEQGKLDSAKAAIELHGRFIEGLLPKKTEPEKQKDTEEKKLTKEVATEYLKKYGDRKKAEEMAKQDGYTW